MAGAGCSGDLYAGWRELMGLLTDEARLVDPNFPPFDEKLYDYLSYADKFKITIGTKYHNVIFTEYGRSVPHLKHHETLVSLPFKGITTTNYDEVLERAIIAVTRKPASSVWISNDVEEAKIAQFLASLNNRDPLDQVFHIHGISHAKTSIILCGEEYRDKYGFSDKQLPSTLFQEIKEGNINEKQFEELVRKHGLKWTTHRKILWSLLATRRVLFIGFSFSDPYFKRMLEYVSEDLHTYNLANHYLVLRVTASSKDRDFLRARELKRKYGVETVFFGDEEGSYKGLEQFIEEMGQRIGSVKPAQPVQVDTPLQVDTPQVAALDPDLTARLMKISRGRHNNED